MLSYFFPSTGHDKEKRCTPKNQGYIPTLPMVGMRFYVTKSSATVLSKVNFSSEFPMVLTLFFVSQIRIQGCRFVPSTFSETKPQMVPRDLNIGFQGLALIQRQIYNPTRWAPTSFKWSYKPYKWPYKWVTGVISPYL